MFDNLNLMFDKFTFIFHKYIFMSNKKNSCSIFKMFVQRLNSSSIDGVFVWLLSNSYCSSRNFMLDNDTFVLDKYTFIWDNRHLGFGFSLYRIAHVNTFSTGIS